MEVIRRKSVLARTLALSLLAAAFGGSAVVAQILHSGQANTGIQEMQSAWYDQNTGFYTTPTTNDWWGYANSITAIGDYEKLVGDTGYDSVLSNTFTNGATTMMNTIKNGGGTYYSPAFSDKATDDIGWQALAWIQAYDVTGNTNYLTTAENLFTYTPGSHNNYMTNAWDTTTCGGGVWWNTDHTYKNAISNELFLEVAAKLANRTTGTASSGYLTSAQNEWTWFKGSGMINASNLINDGLDSSNPTACVNNGHVTLTYNQGVILSGLVELYYAEGGTDTTLLPQAKAIANAVQSSSVLSYVDPTYGNTLVEDGWTPHQDDTNDISAIFFKGAFMRGLADLYEALPATDSDRSKFQTFANNNAKAVWNVDRNASNNQFGFPYLGPVGEVDTGRQESGIAALIAGARTQNLVAYPSWSVGDLSGWSVSGLSSDFTVHLSAGAPAGLGYFGDIRYLREHDATNALTGYAYQDVTATPGDTYLFTVAAKTSSNAGSAGQVTLVNGSTTLCTLNISQDTSWTNYTCTGTVPSSGKIEVRLGANSLRAGESIYYDSVWLTQT